MHDSKAIAARQRESGYVPTVTRCITRADLHCHSSASQLARLTVQRTVALPECATPPQEVHELVSDEAFVSDEPGGPRSVITFGSLAAVVEPNAFMSRAYA